MKQVTPAAPAPSAPKVPLPFFLRNAAIGLGWSRPLTGLFLAVWIIVYGQVGATNGAFIKAS
jgi:hypothetical protein